MNKFLHSLWGAAVIVAASPVPALAEEITDLPGQTEENPIIAVTGEYDIPAFSPVYFLFSSSEDCKIEMSSDIENTEFSVIEQGENWWDVTDLTLTVTDSGFTFKVDSSKKYFITLSKPEEMAEETGKLTLKSLPFEDGEAWQTAIEAESGEVTLPDGPSEV